MQANATVNVFAVQAGFAWAPKTFTHTQPPLTGQPYLQLNIESSAYFGHLTYRKQDSMSISKRGRFYTDARPIFDQMVKSDLMRKTGAGNLDDLLMLALRVDQLDCDLLWLWHFDITEFDREKDVASFMALKEIMRAISHRARNDEHFLRRFHRRTLEPGISEPWGHIFMALGDLVRDDVESDAYFMLSGLAARDNPLAKNLLGVLIHYGVIKGDRFSDIGIKRSMILTAKIMESAKKLTEDAVRTAKPLSMDEARSFVHALEHDPYSVVVEISSLLEKDRKSEAKQIVRSLNEFGDKAKLRIGVENIAKLARSSIEALLLLTLIFSCGNPDAKKFIDDFNKDDFIALIKKYRNKIIFDVARVDMPAGWEAVLALEVEADESDVGYLERLSSRGNKSARQRLEQLRSSVNGIVVPFEPPEES